MGKSPIYLQIFKFGKGLLIWFFNSYQKYNPFRVSATGLLQNSGLLRISNPVTMHELN